jgi:polyisoprenoid-binding protein YceI
MEDARSALSAGETGRMGREPHMPEVPTGKAAITRSWKGLDIPVPGTWEFDPAHTSIFVVGRHSMIVKVRGRFNEFSGRIHVAESPEDSWVEATIQAASVDSGVQMRDDHMRSPDFLDVERFPTFSFRSTGMELGERSTFRVAGDLTILDVTREVELDVEYEGATIDPWGNPRIGFSATGEFEREAFGMTWNQVLERGWLVGKEFGLEIDVAAILQRDEDAS